jgi:hypothetical protein
VQFFIFYNKFSDELFTEDLNLGERNRTD